jgi:hypothetical protein
VIFTVKCEVGRSEERTDLDEVWSSFKIFTARKGGGIGDGV